MMRKLFLIGLSLFIMHASVEIKIEKKISLPQGLKKRFTSYWKARGNKDFKTSYRYELPYLQYLHSQEWYQNFFSQAPKFSKIKIVRKQKCDSDICILGILLFKKFSKEPIFYYDKWIKVENLWYHKYNDNPLPVFQKM